MARKRKTNRNHRNSWWCKIRLRKIDIQKSSKATRKKEREEAVMGRVMAGKTKTGLQIRGGPSSGKSNISKWNCQKGITMMKKESRPTWEAL